MMNYYNSSRSLQTQSTTSIKESKCNQTEKKSKLFSTSVIMLLFLFIGLGQLHAQTTYYSKAAATDFADVNSWGTATDGTGTSPATISNADNFVIQNASVMTLTANASVRQLTITTGSLTVAANTLTVSKATGNDSTLSIASTLTVSGGNIDVNGNFTLIAGGKLNQSGGTISVDGNNAGVATGSVATGTFIVSIAPTANTDINLTGGTFTIVDPHYSTTNTLQVTAPTVGSIAASGTHTFKFGNGVSTDNGGANGFAYYSWNGSGVFKFKNVILETVTGGTNRFLLMNGSFINFIMTGDLTINSGAEFRNTGTSATNGANYFTGNIINNGTFTTTNTVHFADAVSASSTSLSVTPSTSAQTVSGTGVFRNLTAAPTANFTSVNINNSNAGGVTFAGTTNIASQPTNSTSVSGTLTFTTGIVKTSGGASFVLGNSSPSAGTLTYTAGGFASGITFGRWFTAAGTGSSFTAGTDATNGTSRYPFVDSLNQLRSAWIERTTPAAAAGVLAITYTNVAGTTTIAGVDGAATVDTKANDTWSVSSLLGTPLAAASFKIQMVAPGIFGGALASASTRVIKSDNTFVGVHEAGTTSPGGHRITIAPADLTTGSFSLATNNADIPFASIATGNWNNAATWNKNLVPSCTDPVTIVTGTTVTVNSVANSAKNVTIASNGTLTIVASGDLTVGCTLNNNFITNNGTLTVSGGTLNVNGNINNATAASTFNQTGGIIKIDGNDAGLTANSVASGTPLFNSVSNNVTLTGGTLLFVDPHTSATLASSFTLFFNTPTWPNSILATSPNHTTQFGDGVSIDAGGTTNGFYIDCWEGTGFLALGKIVVKNGSAAVAGANRVLTSKYNVIATGDFNVNPNAVVNFGIPLYIGGNLTIDATGSYTNTPATANATILTLYPTSTGTAPVTIPQTITNNGILNTTALTINNSNATGVTLNSPVTATTSLTLTQGFVNTTNTNLLTLGSATAAGTLVGGSATSYVKGPFARTIANGNSAYITYPVGKTVYAPISLAPVTTAISTFKAETFDTNTGTMDPSIIALSTTRRWEAIPIAGTFTNINVRLSDAGIVTGNIPVQAPTAAGTYSSAFGSTATFAAGPPITITSTTPVTSANYTGFLSYAVSNACTGTPAPGATTATAATICLGGSTTLGITTNPAGSGVTYQWQSSPDNVTYTNIATATNSTYTTTPTVATWYQCIVTCSAGPVSGTSTPIQITFTNTVTAIAPGSVCGQGTVTLGATPSTGATINWYAAAIGGTALNTGNTFVTPSLTASTNYYASAETNGSTLAGGLIAPDPTWTGSTLTNWGIIFTALQNINLDSIDLYSSSTGTVNIKVTNSAGTELFSTGNITISNTGTTANLVPINFAIPAGTGYKILVKASTGVNLLRGSTALAFPYTNSNISVTSSEWGGTTTGTYYYIYNIKTTTKCTSPRTLVTATVTTAPTLTLSSNTASTCAGQTTAPITITAGATDYDTYTFSPSTGVTGTAGTGFSFNPTATTTYTLTASQSAGSLCTTTQTITVTVNPLPTAVNITPASATTCANSIQTLTATGGTILTSASTAIGTATTLTTPGGTEPTAFNNRYEHYWLQMVYTQAELTAAGIQAGNINSIKFNITTIGSASNVTDLRLFMGSTSQSVLTGFTTTGISEVFSAATYTHTIGVNTLTFSTPFVWDGVSNIIVDMRSTGADLSNNAETYYTATTDNKTISAVSTADAFTSSNAYVASNPTGTPSLKRLNTIFDWSSVQANPITWSPVTNLYTDALATVPYTAGTNAATVYHMATAATAATTYTATATSASTCTSSGTTSITVNAPTAAPTASAQTFCGSATVANLTATGTGIQWYANATGGTALASTVALTSTNYFATQTVSGCESPRTQVAVTINTTAQPTATSPQSFTAPATIANIVVTGTTGTVIWYPTSADAIANTNALASTTTLVNNTTYYVTQTIAGCPSAPVAVLVNVTLRNNSFDMPSLNYYPNPVIDVVTISYSEAISSIEVYNLVGQMVKTMQPNATTTQLDMSNLPTATYLVKVTSEGKTANIKLVKK